jgi:hypothetical protein
MPALGAVRRGAARRIEDVPTFNKPTNPKDMVGIGKIPSSCVSRLVLAEVGVGMFEGALKYGRHNYRGLGVRASIYFDATMRHLDSWWEGQDIDPATNLSHITKAICSLFVMRDAMIMGMFTDDRPPKNPDIDAFIEDLNAKTQALIERLGHMEPFHYTQLNPVDPALTQK